MVALAKLCPVCGQALKQVEDTHWHCDGCANDFLPRKNLRMSVRGLVRIYLTAFFAVGILWAIVLGIAALSVPSMLDQTFLSFLGQGALAAVCLWPCNPFNGPVLILAVPMLAGLIVFVHATLSRVQHEPGIRRATNFSPAGWGLAALLLSYLPLGGLILAMYADRWRFTRKYGPTTDRFRWVPGLPMPLAGPTPTPPSPPTVGQARRLLKEGRADEAFAQLLLLTSGEAANADALTMLGVAHAKRNEYGQAELALRRALEMNPLSAAIRYNLSLVLNQRGEYMEAAREAQKCLDQGYPVPESFLDRLAEGVLGKEELVHG